MVDVNFICAMGPPGGGRNPVTPRLMRHFNYLAFTELEDPSKRTIFGTILTAWMRTFLLLRAVAAFHTPVCSVSGVNLV